MQFLTIFGPYPWFQFVLVLGYSLYDWRQPFFSSNAENDDRRIGVFKIMQTSKIDCFAKIVGKSAILDVWQGSEHVPLRVSFETIHKHPL